MYKIINFNIIFNINKAQRMKIFESEPSTTLSLCLNLSHSDYLCDVIIFIHTIKF